MKKNMCNLAKHPSLAPAGEGRADIMGEVVGKNDAMRGRAVFQSIRTGLMKWQKGNMMYENAIKMHYGLAFS